MASFTQIDTIASVAELEHSPRKATIYSATLPGLGQIYNKKYWKLPIVYIGIGGFSYFIADFNKEFKNFKTALINRENGIEDEFLGVYSDSALENEMERWRQYRDMCVIGVAVFYVLQIIDANVDAHLFSFDIGDEMSLKVTPKPIHTNFYSPPVLGVGLSIKF
jgi:hypothetical protein